MSSNISVIRICEYCSLNFNAKTTVTRFCSDSCSKRAYKQRIRNEKIGISNQETNNTRKKANKDISSLEYLNPTDASKLLQCSRKNIYELMNSGKLIFFQISIKKRLIRKVDIEGYLVSCRTVNTKILPEIRPFDLANSLSMQEACELFGISEKGLYAIIKKNNIRKYKSGKFVFVEKKDLTKWFNQTKKIQI